MGKPCVVLIATAFAHRDGGMTTFTGFSTRSVQTIALLLFAEMTVDLRARIPERGSDE